MRTTVIRWLAIVLAFTFLAASCGGETESGDSDTETDTGETDTETETDTGESDTDTGETDSDTGETDTETGDDETGTDSGGPNIYDDPRDGIFDEFQQTFDRGDHPFTQVDQFCVAHDAAADRVDTDPGITADAINIGHLRSRLEDAVDIGFGIPVGDPKEMFEVLVDYINTECGGIRGRQLNLGYAEADLLGADVEASRNRACLEMTEDQRNVIVMNSSGFQGSATLCLVEEQETAFISTQGQTEEFMARGEDRLISLSFTLEEALRILANDLMDSGALDGTSIGVAAPNTPGQYEAVENGLVQTLTDAGFDVVFDELDCGGGTSCTGGVPESVQNMLDADVDVFFNVLNILSAPGYINEMVTRGFEPGDVQFYATDFNSQTSELVSGQIANNPEAGALYDGAVIIDFRSTGEFRDADYVPNPFIAECNRIYGENSPSGTSHDWDVSGETGYTMVGSVCGIIRMAARAIYDAGDNPTIADVQTALASLGPIDNNTLTPASIMPGKTQSADAIQTLDFSYPCELPLAFERSSGEPICITGRGDWRPAPR